MWSVNQVPSHFIHWNYCYKSVVLQIPRKQSWHQPHILAKISRSTEVETVPHIIQEVTRSMISLLLLLLLLLI